MEHLSIDPTRAEILRLRARIVVLEKASLAALELALRIRPEDLTLTIELARSRLDEGYHDVEFARDVTSEAERTFLATEVERLMRALQSELGFHGGIQQPEAG
ncbi:MAG: hypothetical protein JWM36_3277 [Hyphomicrobiales bacterium]|nr:hypothetical protein [Hyphomicrobiales bacterium]